MSAEAIINAMGNIDEELIDGCDELRSRYVPKPISYGKWLSVAACVLLVSAVSLVYMLNTADVHMMELSGNAWWRHENPITYTERPEREQVAVAPTETPVPTIEATVLPTKIPSATEIQNIEAPLEEEINWMQYIAELDPEEGSGAAHEPGSRNEAVAERVPEGQFIGSAGDWTYEVIYGGTNYIARKSTLTGGDIAAFLGEHSLSGYEKKTDVLFTGTALVYEISNVSPKAAVAVEIEGNYFAFINKYYSANSLFEFLNDFNLVNTSKLVDVATFNETDGTVSGQYKVVNSTDIWNALLKNESYAVDFGSLDKNSDINISMTNYLYGFSDMAVALYKEGYINMNLLGFRNAYYIGEDAVNEIIGLYSNQQEKETEIEETEEPFSVYLHDAETGETTKQYYDMGTVNGNMSTDAWFPE